MSEKSLQRHQTNCVCIKEQHVTLEYVEQIKRDYETQILELKSQISELEKGVTRSSASTKNKLAQVPPGYPLVAEWMQAASHGYTYDRFTTGMRGFLSIIKSIITIEDDEGTIRRNYVCTDSSRNKFHRLNEKREWEQDDGGKYINVILDNLFDKVDENMSIFMEDLEKMKDTDPERYEGRSQNLKPKLKEIHDGVCSKDAPRKKFVKKIRVDIREMVSI